MNPDPFEQRLARQLLRPVPTEWRDAVLPRAGDLQSPNLASAAATDGDYKSPARVFQLSTFNSQLRDWLWPCPQAWAGLAAVWVLLLAVHFADDSAPARSAHAASRPISPAELHYAWREQQKLLAELFPPEPVSLSRPRVQPVPSLPAPPRSEYRLMRSRTEEIV